MLSFIRKKGSLLIWLESFILAFGLLAFFYLKCGVYFETNDDRIINEILTGVLSGTPDGHAIRINYLLGSLLASLYSLTLTIPWFGGLLICSYLAVYWCFFGILLERCKTLYQHLLGIACGIFFVCSNLYIFGEIQYTTTACVLASGGYFCLLMDKHKYRRFLFFGGFELLAVLLRSQAMLMIQIPGLCILLLHLLGQYLWKEQKLHTLLKELLLTIGILLTCLGISWVGNYVIGDFLDPEWQEYITFIETSGVIDDYYGYPDYESVSELFEKYKVSDTEYLAFMRYWTIGNVLDPSCLEELCAVAKQNYMASRSSLLALAQNLFTSRFQGSLFGYGKYTLMLYAFACMLILLQRKWPALLPLLGLNLGRNVTLAYLLYRSRLPFRVLSGLYFIEIMFLLTLLFLLLAEIRKEKLLLQAATCCVALVILLLSADTARDAYHSLQQKHEAKRSYSTGMEEIISYCTGNDAGYLFAEMTTTYFTGEALNTSWYRDRNYLCSGFWWSTSPHISAYQAEYIREHQGNLKLVDFGPGIDPGRSYAVNLFTQDFGLDLTLTDELQLSNGIVLQVYDIQGDFEPAEWQ